MAARAVACSAARELIPFYGVYALLFADNGLTGAQVSALFVIWSVTGFLAEIPSGAWADTVPRRTLLLVAAGLLAAGFSAWILWPTFVGFAAGFVAWGLSGALWSGTFEALIYDELVARHAADRYPALMGRAHAAEYTAAFAGILSAGPLYAAGGYGLVGWLSVAIAAASGLLVLTLPAAPPAIEVSDTETAATQRYLDTLRSGLTEVVRSRTVGRGVLVLALLSGFTAIDEYFPLVARQTGATTVMVPVLVAITVAGQVIGALLAGRTATLRAVSFGRAVAVAGVLIGVGALVGGAAGFVAMGVGYGTLANVTVVAEARLQDAVVGSARATVTSAAGLGQEVGALSIYAAFAVGSGWLPVTMLVAIVGLPMVATSLPVGRWLPPRTQVRER